MRRRSFTSAQTRMTGAIAAGVAALALCGVGALVSGTGGVAYAGAGQATAEEDTGVTIAELYRSAEQFGGKHIVVARSSVAKSHTVIHGIGLPLRAGYEPFTPTSGFRDGIFIIEDLQYVDANGEEVVTLEGVSIVAIGETSVLGNHLSKLVTSTGTISVTCPANYYACCGPNRNGQLRAKCIRNGTQPPGGTDYPTSCTSGGEPASSCSISPSAIVIFETAQLDPQR